LKVQGQLSAKASRLLCATATLVLTGFVAGALAPTMAAPATGPQKPGKVSAGAQEGASLFRANCSPCHGLNARGGGRGPDLTSGRWTHGSTDSAIFRTITQGVPGTEMPANGFTDSEVRAIIAYLRSLSPPRHQVIPGNAVNGRKVFFGSGGCSNCHMVRGSGGLLGPDCRAWRRRVRFHIW
jgi:cytochrome c oxidase cbb3-type subunit 3